jgi:hypothetical protein
LKADEAPDFLDNITFMIEYQLGHMYFRYFMWNFAGRSGDVQHSSWLKPWQKAGNAPTDAARNQYWMIPLLIGLSGAVFQYRRDRPGFVLVTMLFLITGLILALYLNAPPNEPRERDYIYVGSFIAYRIWIGAGLLSLGSIKLAHRYAVVAMVVASAGMPAWILYQNYDDHDRSGRTFQVDNARNVLMSCAPGGILFTGGDNDTFPLWYLQEVEGFRTDVRVMVLSYMNTDWYINQLRKGYYDSPAFRLTLREEDYRQYGPNDVLYVQETIKDDIDVGQFISLLGEKHPALRRVSGSGEPYHILPSRFLSVRPSDTTTLPVRLHVSGNYLPKNVLAILDLLISNGWERPVYFNFSSLNSLEVDLSPYVIQEGHVYRLRPERNNTEELAVDKALSYRNLITRADYGNLADSSVHFSYEDHFARMIVPLRHAFNDLANAYLLAGDEQASLDVLRHAVRLLYHQHLPPSYTNIQAAELLLAIGEPGMADELNKRVFDHYSALMWRDGKPDGKAMDLEMYLVRRSAELLASTGNSGYLRELARLTGGR